jgi:serine/threonine protein kinase
MNRPASSSPAEPGADTCAICGARRTEERCAACGSAARPGGYEVRRLIARTPHSRVYLARGPGGQEVALKELLFAQIPGPQELESLEREARMLEALSHPRIPRLLGHFQEGEGAALRLYVAAEYIVGETLLERLSHHAFTEEEARDIALQVLGILEYLHGRKPPVLHRDIKPANIIRRPDGTLVLVDFGSARESVRGSTVGSTLVGTFGYMPLEQLGGTVSVTSDLYALGATLVHLLGGTAPADHFQPDRGLDLSHLDAPVLRPWLRKLTALRPEERYPSAALARQALESLRPGGRPVAPAQAPSAPSPEVPAALARLAREAQAARAATAESQGRSDRQALTKTEREAREREERSDRLADDRLTLLDFYRMACVEAASPSSLPWIGFLIAMGVYIVTVRVGIVDVPGLLSLEGVLFLLGLLLAAYAALGGPALIQALRWQSAFRRLPFTLEGLGRLLRRGEGQWRKFTRCSLRLVFREEGAPPGSAELVKTAQGTALQLAVDRTNAAFPRMAQHPEFFQKLRWTLQDDKAVGYANARLCGHLLTFCTESLAPLQRELGLLQAVRIEPTEESFRLPDKKK